MSEESNTESLSKRRRQLLRQGDAGRIRPRLGESELADAGEDADMRADDRLIDNRFRLLRRLGSGRLGDIYEARVDVGPESSLEPRVALQLFDRRITADLALIEKLRRGYAALRAGPHRNVVRLDELGRDATTWYLVMERLEGVSLRFVLDDAGPLSAEEAMPIVATVGETLTYLHAKGMVHGALAPGSVFVTEDHEVRLLDIVPSYPPSGLPADGAPDSLRVPAPDRSDDVFGLACLAYELLTGRHPYNFATAAEAHRQRLEPRPIDHLPPLRWQALARGLAPDREQRPSSVAVFLLDLGIAGSGRPGQAAPPGAAVAAAAGDEPPLIPTARDRLVATGPPRETGRGRWLWSGFGAAVVGLLAAIVWVYQIPIRDLVVDRLAAVGIERLAGDASEDGSGDGSGDGAVEGASAAPGAQVAGIDALPPAEAGGPARAATDDVGASGAAPVAEDGQARNGAASTRTEPETVVPQGLAEDQAPSEGASEASSGLADPDVAAASEAEPRFLMPSGVISVLEGDVVAITVRREGDLSSPATIVWWTSDETARAGDDYADFGEQTEEFAPGAETVTLYVPLVDDGLPEGPEVFVVAMVRPNPGSQSVDAIATTRVEIRDDDNSPR